MAGGKGANLGEISRLVPVPPGFVVTSHAYRRHLEYNGLVDKIYAILRETIRERKPEEYEEASRRIRRVIEDAPMPPDVERAIKEAYAKLSADLGIEDVAVAVRSSATAEDIEEASFAGQQETYLNVRGADNVVAFVKKVWSSLFTARAIFYRDEKGIPHEKVAMAVVVQKLVNSRSAGVMFTLDPTTGDRDVVVIEAAWGLGEGVVAGKVTPDEFVVDKATLAIRERRISEKKVAVVRDEKGLTREVELPPDKAKAPALSDEEVRTLASYGITLERHYNHPMDIEFAVDADIQPPNNIFIVQARPETVHSRRGEAKQPAAQAPSGEAKVVVKGIAASPGVASGRAVICFTPQECEGKMRKGDILVTKMTDPDWVPYMRMAAAIVTDEGGRTSHAAIVSRELGIPAVVGTGNATQVMKEGQVYTVDGGKGLVYEGVLEEAKPKEEAVAGVVPREIILHIYRSIPTGTKVYMNLGVPEKIDDYKDLPFDGIGLMRIEFVLSSYIGEHPLYLAKIGQRDKFVNKLAEGIAYVARAIWPRPVVVRLSDFKSNEYRGLRGGAEFEPEERNPMLGWRGASRYVSRAYREGFMMELEAIKNVREEWGLKNVWIMIPFVRSPWEAEQVVSLIEEAGLRRGRDFKVWAMAEVPSIALMVEEFAKYFDGFSIGSNDLTQLLMGVDRDNEILVQQDPRYFDEREPVVLKAIYEIIKRAHRMGRTVSICGQGPSVYPQMVEFLVRAGIDSISVNPDAVISTRLLVASVERRILLERTEEIYKRLTGKSDEDMLNDIFVKVFGGLNY